MSIKLSRRQAQVLAIYRGAERAPTLQEVADELGITRVTVLEHVERLIEKRPLRRRRGGRARSSYAVEVP